VPVHLVYANIEGDGVQALDRLLDLGRAADLCRAFFPVFRQASRSLLNCSVIVHAILLLIWRIVV
jgi:hypothetical protein